MEPSPFCSLCNRFVEVEVDANNQAHCATCHSDNIERIPQDRIIDFDVAVMEEEDSTVFTIHNGDVVIRRNRQGGIAINITSFTTLNRSIISRICNILRPSFHFDLDGSLSAEEATVPRPRFSNRVRDALSQLLPNIINPSARSLVAALSDQTPTEAMLSEECPICLNGYTQEDRIIELPCKHSFHHSCILEWANKHNTCPICRETIAEKPLQERPEELD
ncbi:hypothetical protein WA556_002607 [Blastocystis sp. ATCC 50177/Nand II]